MCSIWRYFFVLFLFPYIVGAQTTNLKLASDIWPPFTNEPGSQAIAIELVQEALSRLGIEAENEIIAFGDVIKGIQAEAFDGSAALWYNEDRTDYLHFSMPFLQNQLVLIGRKGADVRAFTFSALAGKKVAIVDAYSYGEAVDTAYNVGFVPGKSDQENLNRLLSGHVDYMLADALLIEYLITYQKEEARKFLTISPRPLLRKSLHFGLRKTLPESEKILAEFNRTILAMVADGTYNKILKLNWLEADVDGDGKDELVLSGNKAGMAPPTAGYDIFFEANTIKDNEARRYYIQGQFYDDWSSIPREYKVPPVQEDDLSRIGLLSFSF